MKKITFLLPVSILFSVILFSQPPQRKTAGAGGGSTKTEVVGGDVEAQYKSALLKGKVAEARADYKEARDAYLTALALKPDEVDMVDKLDILEQKITKEDSLDVEYNVAKDDGDKAAIEKDYVAALAAYQKAGRIKPKETYPAKQIQWLTGTMRQDSIKALQNVLVSSAETEKANQDSLSAVAKERKRTSDLQYDIQRKRAKAGMEAYAKYSKAAEKGDLEQELFFLKKFLNIIPSDSVYYTLFNPNQYTEDPIEFARTKIQSIRDYFTRIKGASYQLEVDSIPYLDQELEKKYEDVNLKYLPDEQVMTPLDTVSLTETIKQSKTFEAQPARLKISDSAQGIKLFCESIGFSGEKMFLKLRVKNTSGSDFLTGQMYLTIRSKKGKTQRDDPFYISSRPIILPGKEFVITYGAKNIAVTQDDVLSFELNDRLKKKKVTLNIPVTDYNAEKQRKE